MRHQPLLQLRILTGLLRVCAQAWSPASAADPPASVNQLIIAMDGWADRNFKRYCATVPSGMHPRGWGGHRTPPQPRARRLAVRPAGSKQATGWRALPGILAWGDGQQPPASRCELLWPTLGETMGP